MRGSEGASKVISNALSAFFDLEKISEGVRKKLGFFSEGVKKNWPFLRGALCRHFV